MLQYFLDPNFESLFINGKYPTLNYFCDIDNVENWVRPMHRHEHITEVLFIRDGSGNFVIDNHSFVAERGSILISNSGTLHDERSEKGEILKTFVCGISDFQINGLARNHLIPEDFIPVLHAKENFDNIHQVLTIMANEIKTEHPGFEESCQFLFAGLLPIILRLSIDQEDAKRKDVNTLVKQTMDFIDRNFQNTILLADIAKELFVSPFYLAHLFKRETGFSPIQYLINRRIGEAQNLLITTDKTVTEIANTVGYDNPNYFNQLFKSITHFAPGAYRKIHSKETEK